jgi:uncharacterized membrane protein YdjX (TVP38/TMEM64 family)
VRAAADPKVLAVIVLSILLALLVRDLGGLLGSLGAWGYAGAFAISAASSATVLLPAPGSAAVVMMAPAFHPVWLGVVSGLGMAIGSMTAYAVGAQAASPLKTRHRYRALSRYVARFGTPLLFLCNLVPMLPMDVAGLAAGATRYPAWRYLALVTVASVIKMTGLMLGASALATWVQQVL